MRLAAGETIDFAGKLERILQLIRSCFYGPANHGRLLGFAVPPGGTDDVNLSYREAERKEILELEKRSVRLYSRISTARSGSNQEIRE